MATSNNQQVAVRAEGSKFLETIRSESYQQKFRDMLPADVPVGRFTSVVIRAVQEDPNLLKPSTDKTSLFLACQRAAQDGLIPDKREGALVMYGNQVQWQVMIGGLRKILAKHGFDLRADVVYENDTFDYDLGDDPHITHKAPPLGTPRGKMIGVYAIARGPEGRRYRAVMDNAAGDYATPNAKAGAEWTTCYAEMAKRTVGRRLVKSLPLYSEAERLRDAIEADNVHFDLSGGAGRKEPSAAAQAVQQEARRR